MSWGQGPGKGHGSPGVYPSKSSHMATPAKRKAWEEKVAKKTTGNGTEFVGYSVDSGVWEFKTQHW